MRSMETTTVPTIADSIKSFLTRFVAFPSKAQADVLTLWVLHTWAFDVAYNTPYLYITSAGPQSGKTRTIEVCELLARNAISAASMSASAMFRAIDPMDKVDMALEDMGFAPAVEKIKPTLFVDEVDAVWSGASNEELRGVLNSGYKHNGATLRTVGNTVERFSTFCPKLLAGIDNGQLPDTIADRSITILLRRSLNPGTLERFRLRQLESESAEMKSWIKEWVNRPGRLERLDTADPRFLEGLSDRAFDIAEPLINIADELSHEWGVRARESLMELLAANRVKETPLTQILKAASEYTNDGGNASFIPSATMEELTGIPSRRIAHILKPHGAQPVVTTIKIQGGGKKNIRGYHWHELKTIMEGI